MSRKGCDTQRSILKKKVKHQFQFQGQKIHRPLAQLFIYLAVSSVGVAITVAACGRSRVRIVPHAARNCLCSQKIPTGPPTLLLNLPVLFSRGKATGAWSYPLTSSAEVKYKWSCTSTPPVCPRGMNRDNFSSRTALHIGKDRRKFSRTRL
jgi:hypothetical protein